MRSVSLPPLPTSVFSPYGPIPVERVEDLKDPETGEPLFGYWDPYLRVIYVRAPLHDVAAWLTLLHERTHADLGEVGVSISRGHEEAVCNAIASARLLEMLDGMPGTGSI